METDVKQGRRPPGWPTIAALAFLAVGLLTAAVPFISQMQPNPATPVPETTDLEIGTMETGEHRVVAWKGLPVLVKKRSRFEIEASRAVPLDQLSDRFARNDALSATSPADEIGRTLKGHPEWLVVIAVNPQSGCRLRILDAASRFNDEAFLCPCDGSRFDELGRVRAGPARSNLRIPPVRLVNPNRLRIG